jgi:transcriptional regulator with XRE-family HTH domain
MSKNKSHELSETQRVNYAAEVKSLRHGAGLTQQQLANAAGISRPTLISLERGERVPQSDVLLRVLAALGVEAIESKFENDTELWLQIIGSLIEAIPEDQRGFVVERAIRVLAAGVKTSAVGESQTKRVAPVTQIHRGVDLLTVPLDFSRGAASTMKDSEHLTT